MDHLHQKTIAFEACVRRWGYESDAGPQTANHIVVDLAVFSDGFSAFKKACGRVWKFATSAETLSN
jgi:hypothetical protein